MRLSELLGMPVFDADHQRVGTLADVVLVQDGPLLEGRTAALRVAGLIVVASRHMRLLGYERDLRPAIFRLVVRRLADRTFNVTWDEVAGIDNVGVHLQARRADLEFHRRDMRA
jgi:sporulation protein YlmC with PRC-barrel domain